MAKSVTRTYLNKVKSLLNDTNTNIKALSNALVEKGILDSSFKNKACTAGDILAGLAEYESYLPVLMSEDEEGAVIAEFDDINASGTAIKTGVIAEMPIKGYGKDGLTYIDPTNISKVYNSINNTTVATDRADGDMSIKRWTSRSIFKFLDIYYKYDRRKFEIPVKDIRNGLFLRKGNDLDGIVDKNGLSLYPYPEEIIMISEKKESNFIHFINVQYTDAHYGHFNGRNYNFMIVRDRERIGKLNSEGTGFETYLSVYANDVDTELAYIDKKDDGEWYWNIPVPDKVYGEEMLDSMWDVRIVWRRDEPDRSFSVSYDLEVKETAWLEMARGTLPAKYGWRSICYGKDKFVAIVYNSNVFAYSSDGITWTQSTLPSKQDWNSVCYGKDKFVVVSEGIGSGSNIFAYSSDGITWTQGTLPVNRFWYSVCYGKDKFVTVSRGATDVFAYSLDGITWTQGTLSVINYCASVCYGKDKFVAVSNGGTTLFAYSTDGITWTKGTLPSKQEWWSVCYGKDKFVAVTSSDIFAYSSDGITWTQGTLPLNSWQSVCYGKDKFVVVGNKYSSAPVPNPTTDIFAYSLDGITWTEGNMPSSQTWNSVCYGKDKFVAVANNNNAVALIQNNDISALDFDIVDDRVHLINESTENVANTRNQVAKYSEYAGKKNFMYEPFLLNDGGNIVSGSKFENENKLVNIKMEFKATQGALVSDFWQCVCYGKDKFVAVSRTSCVCAYSSDGITWKQLPFPIGPFPSTGNGSTWLSDLCYGKDKFVIISYNSNVFGYSSDGITWKLSSSAPSKYWRSVCYGKDKYVAVANDSNTFVYSTDGITWTQGTIARNVWNSVCYGKDKFVAVASNVSMFVYSTDGITWTKGTLPASKYWKSVCYGKDKYVAVAYNTDKYTYSSDGITWTQGNMPSKQTWSSVCYGKDKYVTVANDSSLFAYSLDGITWTQGDLSSHNYRHSICYGKDKFVTVEGGDALNAGDVSNTFEYLQDTLTNPEQIPTQIFKLSPDSPLLPNGYIGFSYRTDLANRGDINGFNKDDVLTGECYIIFYDKNLQHIKTINSGISGNGTDYMDLVYKKIGSETEFMLIANIVGASKRYSQLCIDINCNIINTWVDNIIFDDISLSACYSEIKLGFYNKKWLHTYRLCINGIIDDKIDTDHMRLSLNEDAVKESSTISVATNINGPMVYPIEYLPILVGRENIITLSNSISANNISIHDYNTAWGDIAVNRNLHVIAQKRNYAIIEDTSGSKSIVKLIEKYTFDKELLANPTV